MKTNLDKFTFKKINQVPNWQKKTVLEVAREAKLTLEAVSITLERYGYKINN